MEPETKVNYIKAKLWRRLDQVLRLVLNAAFIANGVPWLWIFFWSQVPGPLFMQCFRAMWHYREGDEHARPTTTKLLVDYASIALLGILAVAADHLLTGVPRLLILSCACSFSAISYLNRDFFAKTSESMKSKVSPRAKTKSPPLWALMSIKPIVFFYLLNGGNWTIAVATSVLAALALGGALGASQGVMDGPATQSLIKFSAKTLLATAFLCWITSVVLHGPISYIAIGFFCTFASLFVVSAGFYGGQGCCGGSCGVDPKQKKT